MIKADFYTTKDGAILGFHIYGHSEYGDAGNDIVCASVSSAAYMVANTITDIIYASPDIEVEDDGGMYLMLQKKSAASCYNILAGLKLHLIALEEQYPNNLSVNYMEV